MRTLSTLRFSLVTLALAITPAVASAGGGLPFSSGGGKVLLGRAEKVETTASKSGSVVVSGPNASAQDTSKVKFSEIRSFSLGGHDLSRRQASLSVTTDRLATANGATGARTLDTTTTLRAQANRSLLGFKQHEQASTSVETERAPGLTATRTSENATASTKMGPFARVSSWFHHKTETANGALVRDETHAGKETNVLGATSLQKSASITTPGHTYDSNQKIDKAAGLTAAKGDMQHTEDNGARAYETKQAGVAAGPAAVYAQQRETATPGKETSKTDIKTSWQR